MSIENAGLDNNKSALTLRITAGAETYLANRGFKPVETEVPIEPGWIADIASACVPTQTEMINLKLIKNRPKMDYSYLTRKFDGKPKVEYWNTPEYDKIHDAYNAKYSSWHKDMQVIPKLLTALVEVKTTRSDFMGDPKWLKPSPVNLRYLAIPAGMLKRPEYPKEWGILEFGADGKLIRVTEVPKIQTVTDEQRMWLVHSVSLRRHHRTANRWNNEMMKKFGAQETVKKQNYRISNVAKAIIDVLKGENDYRKNPADCFRMRGLELNRINTWEREQIEKMWGLMKDKSVT